MDTDVDNHTQLQDSRGNLYKTTAAGKLITGNTAIPIRAVEGGAFGNLPAGAPMTLSTAKTGINGSVVVDGAGLSGGVDAEAAQDFGKRIADRVKNPPSGSGTVADYERWALSVPGVTRATASPAEDCPGMVTVRFVMDGNPNGFLPGHDDIQAVCDVIEADRPLTDTVRVKAPDPQIVNYTLSPSVSPSVRPAVAQALAAMHAGLAIGAGLSVQAQIIPAIFAAECHLDVAGRQAEQRAAHLQARLVEGVLCVAAGLVAVELLAHQCVGLIGARRIPYVERIGGTAQSAEAADHRLPQRHRRGHRHRGQCLRDDPCA